MPALSTEVRIFLSSTFVDLKALREEIANSLREVLGAQLIVMETLGSDEAPPSISSVRRVRECDVFVGVYARRYGTIDPASGKSITELELDEAERALSAGNMLAILLYLLDDDVAWPAKYCDSDPTAIEKLLRLKQHARRHTVTLFQSPNKLPLRILRDTLSKLRSRIGAVSPRVRQFNLPDQSKLQRPTGMAFLSSIDREHFHGRDREIEELLQSIDRDVITLLVGNSGVGKTSLIHAGLIPRTFMNGWLPIYTRPLGLPRSDVSVFLSESVFEGPSSWRGSLIPLVEQVLIATHPRRLLLIIDQFEDILTAREPEESNRLVADLHLIRRLDDRRIRVLVSYRADLEARLGQFWQFISGSPEGLARVYIKGIGEIEAWRAIESACDELGVRVELIKAEKLQLTKELLTSSASHGEEGIYPPYIQMLVDHMWRTTQGSSHSYRMTDYLAAGGIEGVTGGYLSRQLAYAQDTTGHVRAILVSLVRSYGVKAQKSLPEIASDVGFTMQECETSLERLIDFRLVRHIGDQYEVAHDFLAQEISRKLVDSEEREFKRFRELLSTKAAAFVTTRGRLTVEELLVLFNHRDRVLPSDNELRLIFASWAREEVPGLYWITSEPAPKVVELIRAEEREKDLEDENRAMLALLLSKLNNSPLRARDWLLFRRYKLGIELAGFLSRQALQCPVPVVLFALRSRHGDVRAAASAAIAQKVASGNRRLISELGRSSSPPKRKLYEALSLQHDLSILIEGSSRKAPRTLQEFVLLQRVSRARNAFETRAAYRALKAFRPRARSLLFAKGILTQRTRGLLPLLRKLSQLGGTKSAVLLNSVSNNLTKAEFNALLGAYLAWNEKEAIHIEARSRRVRAYYEDKATALAETIVKVAATQHLKSLRQMFERITLTPSAQYYVLAFLRVGKTRDVLSVIRKVERTQYDIRYWFHVGVARAVEKRMKELGRSISPTLLRKSAKRAFWEDPRYRRPRPARKEFLPLANPDNRALYVRLVAHATIGAAGMENSGLLGRLAQHGFRLIARAAAIRLTELAGEDGVRILQSLIPSAIEQGNAESLGLALRYAEIHKLGVAALW